MTKKTDDKTTTKTTVADEQDVKVVDTKRPPASEYVSLGELQKQAEQRDNTMSGDKTNLPDSQYISLTEFQKQAEVLEKNAAQSDGEREASPGSEYISLEEIKKHFEQAQNQSDTANIEQAVGESDFEDPYADIDTTNDDESFSYDDLLSALNIETDTSNASSRRASIDDLLTSFSSDDLQDIDDAEDEELLNTILTAISDYREATKNPENLQKSERTIYDAYQQAGSSGYDEMSTASEAYVNSYVAPEKPQNSEPAPHVDFSSIRSHEKAKPIVHAMATLLPEEVYDTNQSWQENFTAMQRLARLELKFMKNKNQGKRVGPESLIKGLHNLGADTDKARNLKIILSTNPSKENQVQDLAERIQAWNKKDLFDKEAIAAYGYRKNNDKLTEIDVQPVRQRLKTRIKEQLSKLKQRVQKAKTEETQKDNEDRSKPSKDPS